MLTHRFFRLLVVSSVLTLSLLCCAPLGGCDDEKTVQDTAARNIAEGTTLVAKWRAAAASLPDTDSRKGPWLAAIARMDDAIHGVSTASLSATVASDPNAPTPLDPLKSISNLVPWGATALGLATAAYKTVQSYGRAKEINKANDAYDKARADANSFAYAIDAHNDSADPAQKIAFNGAAIAELTPGAKKILNTENISLDHIPVAAP